MPTLRTFINFEKKCMSQGPNLSHLLIEKKNNTHVISIKRAIPTN